jgi:hypothetical protein
MIFNNNELFKLLCWGIHKDQYDIEYGYGEAVTLADGSVELGYDTSKSGTWNLEQDMAKGIITAFDEKYNIKIYQVEPQNLTPEMVQQADLLYIAKSTAMEGIMAEGTWASIRANSEIASKLPPLTREGNAIGNGLGWLEYPLRADQDLHADTLYEIYKQCIVERKVALMADIALRGSGDGLQPDYNLEKLIFLMNYLPNARDFTYFMPNLYPDADLQNMVQDEQNNKNRLAQEIQAASAAGDIKLQMQLTKEYMELLPITPLADFGVRNNYSRIYDNRDGSGDYANMMVNVYLMDGIYNKQFDENNDSTIWLWRDIYFLNTELKNGRPGEGGFTVGQGYIEGETKLTIGNDLWQDFQRALREMSIWKILDERHVDERYNLQIIPLNADEITLTDGSTIWAIYGNEFETESFRIDYEIRNDRTGVIIPDANIDTNTYEITVGGGGIGARESGAATADRYSINVRDGFALPGGTIDPNKTSGTVKISALDNRGAAGEVEVRVIIREAFSLN